MKNILFMVAGLAIVGAILVATMFHEPAGNGPTPNAPGTSIETPVVVPEPTPEEEPVIPPEEMTSVKVFFSNSQQDPNTENCEVVYAVDRVIEPTAAVAKEALDQLLADVTETEQALGYFSNLNSQARVVSIAIENGVATVEFNSEFQFGLAGSCRVSAVRAQVEETLKQFASVQEVIIKVEGVADDEVLQP